MPTRRLFTQTLVLLILYLTTALLTAVKFLPGDPLAATLPYHMTSAMSHLLLQLALLTGLLGVGVQLSKPRETPLLRYALFGWTILLVISFIAALLGFTESRPMLELPPLLDVVQIALLSAFFIVIARSQSSGYRLVWLAGLGIYILSTLFGLINSSDLIRENALTSLVVGMQFNLAYPLMGFAAGFCLFESDELTGRLYLAAGMLAIAGSLQILANLNLLTDSKIIALLGGIAVLVIPAAHLFLIWQSRAARSSWYILGLALFICGSGILGTIHAVENIAPVIQGTRLTDLQFTLISSAIMIFILGSMGQTALIPFWFVAAGSAMIALMLGGAGLVQVYMERLLSLGYLDTQRYLVPLYAVWIAGLVLLTTGVIAYAVLFWRRPSTQETF